MSDPVGTATISPTCPRCGSVQLRRSMPRTLAERAIRACTPLHLFLCRDCEHRGWRLGRLAAADHGDHLDHGLPARPLEARDHAFHSRRRRRILVSVAIATLLGAAAGVYLHGCQQRAELAQPPAE